MDGVARLRLEACKLQDEGFHTIVLKSRYGPWACCRCGETNIDLRLMNEPYWYPDSGITIGVANGKALEHP